MRREEQEEKIASLLGGLERVDAPHGFESRVMRRIAEGEPGGGTNRSVLLLVLKFAAPAALLLILGMFFVFFGDSEVSNASVPAVQESNGQVAPPAAAEAPRTVDQALAAASPSEQRPATQQPVNSPPRKRNAASQPQIMSEDLAVQGPGETIRPQGLDPRPRNIDPSTVRSGSIKLTNVLSFIGVNASCGNDGCRVSSVSKGTFADRVGLAAGDRIISIDGRAVNAATEFSSQASFKTFQVDRGGRTLSLSTKSN